MLLRKWQRSQGKIFDGEEKGFDGGREGITLGAELRPRRAAVTVQEAGRRPPVSRTQH